MLGDFSQTFFPIIFSWWPIYYFLVTFISKRLNFLRSFKLLFPIYSCFDATVAMYWKHLSSSLIGIIIASSFFYLIGRIYILSMIQIYFMTFTMQEINAIKEWNRYLPLMFFITLWMRYTLFISVFRRNGVNCYC